MPITITYEYVCIIRNLNGIGVLNQDGNVTDFTGPSESDKLPQEPEDNLLMDTHYNFHNNNN